MLIARTMLVVLFGISLPLVASSATTTYLNDEAGFKGASPLLWSLSFEEEEGFLPGPITSPIVRPEFQISLIPATAMSINNSNNPTNTHPTDGSQDLLLANTFAPMTLRFDFPQPIQHFGLYVIDWGDSLPGTLSLTIESDPSLFNLVTPPALSSGNEIFLGVTRDTPFQTIDLVFTTTDDGVAIDEVYFTAPEPRAVTLMGLCILGLFLRSNMRSRIRRRS